MAAYLDQISNEILNWSASNSRNLPWKSDRDPYKIWISEMILQQTRVAQGLPYYERFIAAFPTIADMATSDIDQVYKLWEGLGYYRRAHYMHETAKRVHFEYGGRFPSSYEGLLQLKGVGPYTAAAIASFAFDVPVPVIDGNVNRIVARLLGIHEAIDTKKGAAKVNEGINKIFDPAQPAAFNQAIMDFGAIQCVPRNPDCLSCPLANQCEAHHRGLVDQIPSKKPRKARRTRHFYYLIIHDHSTIWIRKRNQSDIWQNLYEFYLIESEASLTWSQARRAFPWNIELLSVSDIYQQILTHQKIYATFAEVQLDNNDHDLLAHGYVKIQAAAIRNFAFPKIIDCYLNDKAVNLNLAF